MAVTDLFIQRGDLAGREDQFQDALRRLPGVQSVGRVEEPQGSGTAEVCVRVTIDTETTNAVILRDALQREGFTVLSASEEQT